MSARRQSGIQRNTRLRRAGGRRKATLALALLQLVPALLAAQDSQVTRLFPDRPTDYLTDAAGIVDQASAREINDLAARLRGATRVELAVVTLPGIGDRSPEEVARTIGRTWGVGAQGEIGDSARNAGLVLLLVPRTPEHRGEIFLSTGRGIEGVITDATAGRITDLMLPHLREARYGPALALGTRGIAAVVAREFGVSDSALMAADPFSDTRARDGGRGQVPALIVIVLVLIVVLVISSASGGGRGGRGGGRRRRRSPIIFMGGGGWHGGGWGGGGGFGGGFGGGGFGGFGGGGGFSGGGAGRSF